MDLSLDDDPYHTKEEQSTCAILTLTFSPERDKQN